MSLNAQQKDALAFQLGELMDNNEPAAFMSSLLRIVERQAFAQTRRDNQENAQAWQDIADALATVSHELDKSARKAARERLAKSQMLSEPAS